MKMLSIVRPLVITSAFLACGLAQANLIQNGSFENGTDPGLFTKLVAVNSTSIDYWTVSAGTIDYIGTYWQAAEGARSIDLVGDGGLLGTLSQTFNTTIGSLYTVQFAMAGNPDGGVKRMKVLAGGESPEFAFDTAGKSTTAMGWETKSFQFTALAAQTTLSFEALTAGACCYGPALDNVIVEAQENTVPEPASSLLLGLSLAGLGWSRRIRQQTAG